MTDDVDDVLPADSLSDPPTDSDRLADSVRDEKVGFADLEQKRIIPSAGVRKPSTRAEYWSYACYYTALFPPGITAYGGALMQLLVNKAHPSGSLSWGGKVIDVNSFILDLQGILFAVQLVLLLLIGPYADYGSWGPWLLIGSETAVYIITFAFTGIYEPSQWNAASGLFVIGNLAVNMSTTFLWSQYPAIIRDMPKMIESEQAVMEGSKSAAQHLHEDSMERSKLYCWCTFLGSFLQLCALAVAVGIAAAIGNANFDEQIKNYRVLIGFFGVICVITTVPFFILQKRRSGQQLPAGKGWILAGPRQVLQGAKQARHLKQVLIYLAAYFLLQDAYGTSGSVRGIQQNSVIQYNTVQLSGLSLVGFTGGGFGALFWMVIQQRWKISVRKMVILGGFGTLIPNLWGVVGNYTDKIGFHHPWEFWLMSAYNFMDASWGVFYVTMITEVAPAPKMYLFMSLFNMMGKTSAFIGPFISSAIITRSGGKTNMAYWFLLAMGVLGFIILCFVDPDKAKVDNAKCE
ncbi:autophagy protein [Kockovaella imperatae]|uniref:Autophagy-related protein n=1 Tax=Kockovaella imperatae TaxID=4999 RepID=A0A1Y1UD79_9TREE|nr:autophagy protein [Kockovaella imperatae]ORX35484.1 autophagy protein [Kockovaella imperatae]